MNIPMLFRKLMVTLGHLDLSTTQVDVPGRTSLPDSAGVISAGNRMIAVQAQPGRDYVESNPQVRHSTLDGNDLESTMTTSDTVQLSSISGNPRASYLPSETTTQALWAQESVGSYCEF